MTLAELSASLLVVGDGSSSTWDPAWRRTLVTNLSVLAAHLASVGIHDIFIDGSFCSKKDHPGDIDGYFTTDFPAWPPRLRTLVKADPVWNLRDRRPDDQGKMKPLMWHKYRVELFPVFDPPFSQLSAKGGAPPVTIDHFFHQSRDGNACGVVKLIPQASP